MYTYITIKIVCQSRKKRLRLISLLCNKLLNNEEKDTKAPVLMETKLYSLYLTEYMTHRLV